MQFKMDLFRQLLTAIEYRIKFVADGVDKSEAFDMCCDIEVNELVELLTTSKNYNVDELKYCLSLLSNLEYIIVSNGKITKVLPKGFKLILSVLHGLNCQY